MNPNLDTYEITIEAAVNAGFMPADDLPAALHWLEQRYEGYQYTQTGILGFCANDSMITLYSLTMNGVCQAEAHFTHNDAGLAMFVAATNAANPPKQQPKSTCSLELTPSQAGRLSDILEQSFATSVNHLVSSVEAQIHNPEGDWAKSAPRIATQVETDRMLKLLLTRAITGEES